MPGLQRRNGIFLQCVTVVVYIELEHHGVKKKKKSTMEKTKVDIIQLKYKLFPTLLDVKANASVQLKKQQ